MSTKQQQIIEKIAKECFHVETLETRNRDSLDFYDVAVWTIKEALSSAYNAGLEVGRTMDREAFSVDWFKGSKIVDDAGQPLIMYHGTDRYFEQFDPEFKGSNTAFDNTRVGFFFLSDKERAIEFAKRTCRGDYLIEAHLSIKNPLDFTDVGIFTKEEQAATIYEAFTGERLSPSEALERLNEEIGLGEALDLMDALSTQEAKAIFEANGYDGVIGHFGYSVLEYVAFHPEQIKVLDCYRHDKRNDPLITSATLVSKNDLTQ